MNKLENKTTRDKW